MSKKQLETPGVLEMRAPLTVEAAGDEKQLPRFRMIAYTGGEMRIAGFPHSVVVDLSGLDIPAQNLPIRLDHERRQGVGHTQRPVALRAPSVPTAANTAMNPSKKTLIFV